MSEDEAPPRVGRGLIWRGLLAGVLICLCTAGAVSAAVLLQVDDIINIIEAEGRAPIEIPEIDREDVGKAQTLMILGSDTRYGDKDAGLKPRSDTIILVRLDPDKEVIAMTSIPRDLLVDIPGVGNQVKINAAYENFGERGTVRVVKDLLSVGGRDFKINHVITVDFSGFRKVIDYVGCVYADIDRDYFNDQGGPSGYAVIDIDPGYQKLCGTDALAYVRYRHGDNDLVRGARQQDFLRQVRNQKGIRKLRDPSPGNLKKLARIFARYFDSDKGLHEKQALFKFAKTVLFTAGNPVREVRFRVVDAPDHVNLEASPDMLEKTVSEFLDAKASATPREQTEPTAADVKASKERAKRTKNKPSTSRADLEVRVLGAGSWPRRRLPVSLPTRETVRRATGPSRGRQIAPGPHDARPSVSSLGDGQDDESYGSRPQRTSTRRLDDRSPSVARSGFAPELMPVRRGARRTRPACGPSAARSTCLSSVRAPPRHRPAPRHRRTGTLG